MSDGEQPSLLTLLTSRHLGPVQGRRRDRQTDKTRQVLARGRARPQGQRHTETEKEKQSSIGWPASVKRR